MTSCPRTFALYRPGTPMPGVSHSGVWTGSTPNTGRFLCYLCGRDLGRDEHTINQIVRSLTA